MATAGSPLTPLKDAFDYAYINLSGPNFGWFYRKVTFATAARVTEVRYQVRRNGSSGTANTGVRIYADTGTATFAGARGSLLYQSTNVDAVAADVFPPPYRAIVCDSPVDLVAGSYWIGFYGIANTGGNRGYVTAYNNGGASNGALMSQNGSTGTIGSEDLPVHVIYDIPSSGPGGNMMMMFQ